ncbi:uncharacterized protein [Diabrotica undecimpunctata]|uniref:uncharacterized protein n=1 Tax=Diabrotica undecimpunctata TaxID=50387 RepID=UPI003B63DCD2
MAYKCREEIVGKRFLSVSGICKLKSGKISEWGWRSGVIRAATHRDNKNTDLQILVEYDDVEWQRREWICPHKDGLFHLFMVEQVLVWAHRKDPLSPSHGSVLWPSLTFSALVSTVNIPSHLQPIEFLVDHNLAFKDYKQLKPYQNWDRPLPGVKEYPELKLAVKRWTELQDGQRILLTTPSVLVGYRVEVYRAEGTTQWYTAVIIGYNEATRDLTVTDDTVLEEHNEDPSLLQMRLIGDGVVESIMRGEKVGITPRRSRSSALLHQTPQTATPNRIIKGLPTSVTNSATTRKPRSGRAAAPDPGIAPEPPDKDDSVKTKWKTLRDGYNKYKKQVKRDISYGKKSHQYIWSSQLSFLDDVNASNATTSSNTSSEHKPLQSSREATPSLESNDSHSFVELQSFNLPEEETPLQSFDLPQKEKSPSLVDMAASTSQAPVESKQTNRKKRPIQGDVDKVIEYLHDKKKIKQDGIDHLFLSYADTFRKLSPRHQIHIKLELAKLFADAELECLEETEEMEDVKPSFTEISSPCHPTISSSNANPSHQQSEQHNLFQEVDQPEYYLPDNC